MTRKSQIEKAAIDAHCLGAEVEAFCDGAEWADTHWDTSNPNFSARIIQETKDLEAKLADCEANLNLAVEALEKLSDPNKNCLCGCGCGACTGTSSPKFAKEALAKIKGEK